MDDERKFLGEFLIEKGIITKAQLKEAVKEHERTDQKIGEILVRRKMATEEQVAEALSVQLGFIFIDLSTYKVSPKALSIIPAEAAALQVYETLLFQTVISALSIES